MWCLIYKGNNYWFYSRPCLVALNSYCTSMYLAVLFPKPDYCHFKHQILPFNMLPWLFVIHISLQGKSKFTCHSKPSAKSMRWGRMRLSESWGRGWRKTWISHCFGQNCYRMAGSCRMLLHWEKLMSKNSWYLLEGEQNQTAYIRVSYRFPFGIMFHYSLLFLTFYVSTKPRIRAIYALMPHLLLNVCFDE